MNLLNLKLYKPLKPKLKNLQILLPQILETIYKLQISGAKV